MVGEVVDVDAVVFEDFGRDYREFGQALQNFDGTNDNNRAIKSIVVDLTKLCSQVYDDAFGSDAEDEASHDEAHVALLVKRVMEHAGPILRYLRESTILQSICLYGDPESCWKREDSATAVIFLQAVLENYQRSNGRSCCIKKMKVQLWRYTEKSQAVFSNILSTMVSLQHLTISLNNFNLNCEWIVQAFSSNTSLEYLCLDGEGYRPINSDAVAAKIIASLCRHPSLQTLALHYLTGNATQNDTALALSNVLRNTRTLRRLEMRSMWFTEEGSGNFVDGLQSNDGTLVQLDLGSCAFLEAPKACEIFMDYMNSSANEKNHLRELKYHDDRLDRLAESMETSGTIGSKLQALTLVDGVEGQDRDVFLETLVSHGCKNKLESLELDRCNITALTGCLGLFAHLREIKISIAANDWHQVVRAAKKNGSLHKVSRFHRPPFGPRKPGHRYRRHLKAIGCRNQLTPKLLANPRLDRQHDDKDAAKSTSTAVENFPSLFLGSMDAERTAPNTLLIGLLATTTTTSVDPGHGHGKRLCPLT